MAGGVVLAGIDAGHVNTKAVLMRGSELLGRSEVPTGLTPAAAARAALASAIAMAGVSTAEVKRLGLTGIFRDMIELTDLKISRAMPDYEADAKGAGFLEKGSRTVIDIGGNVHKAISYDASGELVDVVQNDKCADGIGIFCSSFARALAVSEDKMFELASRSTRELRLGIQCSLSAESDAVDLLCQGVDVADVANSALGYIIDRVATLCLSFSVRRDVVVAGGLARSTLIVEGLRHALGQDITVLKYPEYVGAIGAAVDCEGSSE